MLAINTQQLLAEIESLPLDLKTKLIDTLLNSLNLTQKEIDSRVESIESGNVDLINGKEVFQKQVRRRCDRGL